MKQVVEVAPMYCQGRAAASGRARVGVEVSGIDVASRGVAVSKTTGIMGERLLSMPEEAWIGAGREAGKTAGQDAPELQ
jgi:hypothetical protein